MADPFAAQGPTIPYYAGMSVRWLSRKPHLRTAQRTRGRRKSPEIDVVELTYGHVFSPSEAEYRGIWDLVEVVGESLRAPEKAVQVLRAPSGEMDEEDDEANNVRP